MIRPIRPERFRGACVEVEEVVLSTEWRWVDEVVVLVLVSGRDCERDCDGWRKEDDIARSGRCIQGRNKDWRNFQLVGGLECR